MTDTSTNNKRIAKNTLFLYIRMFFVLIINLFTARILLNALGVVDYGVYNVVAGFVSLFGFLNATLSASVQRFYNFEGTKKGYIGFQNVYVTSLLTHASIALVLFVILETFGLWYVNNIMVVPHDRLFAANILFQASILSMILMMLQIPYSGAVMAKEHMDFFSVISIVDVILKLLIALAVMYTDADSLITYGILLASVSVIDIIAYFFYCRKHFPEIRITRRFDKPIFKSMLSFSTWNLIGTFAFMLKGQGLNMLLNVYFGPVINAARGIAYQVNNAINGFSSSIYTAFNPQITSSFAAGNIQRTIKMMFVETKVCYILMAIITVPVVLEIDWLLNLWLGNIVPKYTGLFSALVLIDLLICTLNTPCTQIVQATGKIKFYQIGSTIVNICLIPACWILLEMGLSATSSFIATIAFSCINQVVCVYFANREVPFGLINYLKQIVIPILVFTPVLSLFPMIVNYYMDASFVRLIVEVFLSGIAGIILSYIILLNKTERSIVKTFITNKLR